MTKDNTHRETAPFTMFYNGLEMYGRIIESSCKISMNMVTAAERANTDITKNALQAVEQVTEAASQATPKAETSTETLSSEMIPSTGHLESSAEAVASAMNLAAQRKLGAITEDDEAAETTKTVRDAKEAVAKAKSSISAAKTTKSAPKRVRAAAKTTSK